MGTHNQQFPCEGCGKLGVYKFPKCLACRGTKVGKCIECGAHFKYQHGRTKCDEHRMKRKKK